MSDTTFEGETLEKALENAAARLGARVDELEYDVIEEKKKDFWGLDEGLVRIEAQVRAEAPAEQAVEPTPEREQDTDETPEAATADRGPAGPEEQGEDESDAAEGFWGETGREEGDSEEVGSDEWQAPGAPRTADLGPGAAAVAEPQPVPDLGPEPEPLGEADATTSGGAVAGPEEGEGDEQESPPSEATERGGQRDALAPAPLIEDPAGEIETLMERVLEEMEFACTVAVQEEEDGYLVLLGGEDRDLLLEGHGRVLSALELILNHAFRHRLVEKRKIRVDAGDFRSRRDDELRDLAYQVAHSAKESGRTQETQPLNPYERRLVHLALAEDAEVTTRSRGSGFLKNVQVIPRRSGRG